MDLHRFLSALCLLCISAFAQVGFKLPSRDASALIEPTGAVRRFCQMDADGFRLTAETARRLQAVTTWKQLPPWTTFEVVSNFETGAARQTARGVLVPVLYTVLGRWEPTDGFTPDVRTRTIEVVAVQQDGAWKVTGTEELAMPRVSRLRAYRWFRDQANVATDAAMKTNLERAAKELQP